MALSNVISSDVVVEIQDRGPVDGTPASLSVTAVTALVRRYSYNPTVGKDIDVSGFGTTKTKRPGKTEWELSLDILISVSAALSITIGNYVQVESTFGSNSETKYIGYCKSLEIMVDDDGEAIQRLVITGPVDGGTTS